MTALIAEKLNCWRCGRLLAEEIVPPFKITCPRCHAANKKPAEESKKQD